MKKAGKRITMVLLAICFVFASVLTWTDNAYAAKITSASQAKKKALEKVPNAIITDVDRNYEKGVLVYEIELIKGKKEYNIMYRASDGKILEYGWEKKYVSASRNKALIGKSKCKKLARKLVKNGKIVSCTKKVDDGITIYNIKMTAGSKRYTLKYHARTGALIDYEWKLTKTSSNTGSSYISVSKAKQIALDVVPGAIVVKAEFEMDDGVPVYEVKLIKGNFEYEFKIHAETGVILEQEKDWND